MRWCAALAVVAAIWAGAAWAQELTAQERDVAARIDQLTQFARDDRNEALSEGVAGLRKAVEDTRNLALLQRFYALMGVSAAMREHKIEEAEAGLLSAILSVYVHGADAQSTAAAHVSLAMAINSLDERSREQQLQIAASQSLSYIANSRRKIGASADLTKLEAYAHAMLGTSYLKDRRGELALHHLRLARALGKSGILNADRIAAIDRQIKSIDTRRAKKRWAHKPGFCRTQKELPRERRDACSERADLALVDGNARLAEAILRELNTNTQETEIVRVSAAVALYMLLIQSRSMDNAEVVALVARGGDLLAVEHFESAALLAMGTAQALIRSGQYRPEIIELCGHVARRAARAGSEHVALRMLDAQLAMLTQAYASVSASNGPAGGKTKFKIGLDIALVLLEAGSFADLNGYYELAKTYRASAERGVENLARQSFETLAESLQEYTDPGRGFVFPGPGAAAELLGRVAARDASEPGRDTAIIDWIASEVRWRGNSTGALALTELLLATTRASNQTGVFLVELLDKRAELSDDPMVKSQSRRDAYEILSKMPDVENRKIAMLLALADGSNATGEQETAHKLIDEAGNIANATSRIEPVNRSSLAIWQSRIARQAGDLPRALAEARRALDIMKEETRDRANIVAPAMHLADLLMEVGRKQDAHTASLMAVFYEETRDPLVVGEATAVANQLKQFEFEAYHALSSRITQKITDIGSELNGRALADASVQRPLNRVRAFAFLGVGDNLGALRAARRVLELGPVARAETAALKEDRLLLETIVSAAVLAAAQIEGAPAPR